MKANIKKIVKWGVYVVLKAYVLSLGKLLYSVAKKYASFHGRMIHNIEWRFTTTYNSHYKHEISLYNWISDPSQVEFIDGMALVRMHINNMDSVLDLCCGDGSNSYLFFSDIAKVVDAIDYDSQAIKYASKHYNRHNINFFCDNALTYEFKNNYYNIVVWTSAIAYFSPEQRKIIFSKIHNMLKQDGILYLKTPLEKIDSKAGTGQKETIFHIFDKTEFEQEFLEFYSINFYINSYYKTFNNLNYVLKRK